MTNNSKLTPNMMRLIGSAQAALNNILFEKFPEMPGKEVKKHTKIFVGNFLFTLEMIEIIHNGRKNNLSDEEILDSCDDEDDRQILDFVFTLEKDLKEKGEKSDE